MKTQIVHIDFLQTSVRCPLEMETIYEQGCTQKQCVYHSVRTQNGCSYGYPITLQTWAKNKGVKTRKVQQDIERTHENIQHAVLLYRYMLFCEHSMDTVKDVDAETVETYEKLSETLPYQIPALATVFDAHKLAIMQDPDIFLQFQQSERMTLNVSLNKFLNRQPCTTP